MNLQSYHSSSRGNMHLLENGETSIILDCGIIYDSYIHTYLKEKNIDGVLLTHEHGDHVNGCESLSQNKRTYFYSTKETLDNVKIPEFMKQPIKSFKRFYIGTFSIIAFDVQHDAIHPINYLIKDEISGSKLLYITDTGYIDNLEFKDIDYFLIECNFDENWYSDKSINSLDFEDAKTKKIRGQRLLSDNGHLSIQKTIQFLKRTINHNTKKIVLCHLSSSYKDYKLFEDRIKEELNFDNVIALSPFIKQSGQAIDIQLHEKKDVIPFD